jgi:hypothetical protein
MESKVNINPYKPPQFKKQLNASFEKAKIQDLNRITELYTIFKTMDYEEIMAVIETNEILNFKTDKGETLIFALLNNPSSTLNESKIKNIIELLVVKNVSINAMNEFNQNVLHLACKKGYFLVIDYLLSLKCNRELVDNYGNAPIHYVIEEFIKDCKGGEMYNYKNLKLKYLHDNVDVDYLTKLMMVSIIDEVNAIKKEEERGARTELNEKALEVNKARNIRALEIAKNKLTPQKYVQVGGAMTDKPLTTALDHLKKFIGLNRLFKGEEVVMQMKDNITKLGDRYLELLAPTEQKVIKSELQKKMLEQKKEYEQLYSQFRVVMDDIDSVDSFNEYARQIEVKISKEKADCNDKIKEHLDVKLKEKCDGIKDHVVDGGIIYELYDNELYLSYLLYYIYENLNAFIYDADNDDDPNTKIYNKIQDILRGRSIENTLRYVDYYQIASGIGYNMNYKHSDDYRANQYSSYMRGKVGFMGNTDLTDLLTIYEGNNNDGNDVNTIHYFGNQLFNNSFLKHLTIEHYTLRSFSYATILQIGEQPQTQHMFKLDNVKMLCDYISQAMEMIKEWYTGDRYVGGGDGTDGDCEQIITIYTLYETILNIINNLILIKHDIEKHVKTDELKLKINKLKQLMEEEITLDNHNEMFLFERNRRFRIPVIIKYPDEDRTNTASEFFEGIIGDIDKAIEEITKGAINVDRTLNEMYKQLKECIDIINQVINEKNKFFSLTYLEKYIACFKGGAGVGDVPCIFYNRLRKINTSEFPLTFTEYYLKHKAVGEVEVIEDVNLIEHMPDLPKYLVYMHNYNFNIFFKNGVLQEFKIPFLEHDDQGVWMKTQYPLHLNINIEVNGTTHKYNMGYFLGLYQPSNQRGMSKIRDIDNLYPPITTRLEDGRNGQYAFIHQLKQSLQVCNGEDDEIMPIALEHTEYIMKIIIAKIVFVLGRDGEEEHTGSDITRHTGAMVMRGGMYSTIINGVIMKMPDRTVGTKQQAELVKILESLEKNTALLKKFINKYILSLIEKNISVYIGDECGELMALQIEELNLKYPDYAQIVRLMDITPLEFRKGVDMTTLLFKEGDKDIAKEVKEIVVSIYNKRAITHAPNSKKVFRNKCANVSMSNFECIKRLGIRLKDRNGNTILNRLIDQYNIPALKTLIQMDQGIKTFRNNRNQTPHEYIKSLLKIIADKYDDNTLKSRIIKYGYILMSYLEPTALTNVDLELYTSEEFIVTIIKYNICIFNEFLWFHMLEFNNLLTVDELMAVLRSMGFAGIKATDLPQFKTLLASKIDTTTNIEQRIEAPSEDSDRKEDENRTKQLQLLKGEKEESEGNEEMGGEGEKRRKEGASINRYIIEQIKDIADIAQMKAEVDARAYEIYYDIIRNCFTMGEYRASTCPKTVPPLKQPQTPLEIWEIASSLLKLEIKDASDVNISNFFKHFVKKIYEDYYDLDQNEDAEYNYVQHRILSIIFLNVGSIVAFELVNRLMIYCDKHHTHNAPESIVGRNDGEELGPAIKRRTIETRDKIYTYAKDAITDEIIEKLGVKNPDKQYTTTDTHDDIIIDALKTAYSFVAGETDIRDIKQIITFYRTLAENIAKNSYDEMRMILDDLRRKSLLIEIAHILT